MKIQTSEELNAQAGDSRYFRPRRLGHVNLVVNSTEESMRFYNAVIGFEEAYRVVAIKGGFLSNGNTHHDVGMVEASGPAGRGRKPGLNHLAFELETEVDLVNGYKLAVDDGMAFQRTLDHDIAHSAYAADPDGNSCELYADVIRDWRNARTGSVTKPKPEWWPGLTELPATPRIEYGHFFMSLHAAQQGLGVALIPDIVLANIDTRNLRVAHEYKARSAGEYYMLSLKSRANDYPVLAFREWAKRQFARDGEPAQ